MADSDASESNLAPTDDGNGDSELTTAEFSVKLRKESFLRAFPAAGGVPKAARAINIHPKTAFRWIDEDSEFREAFRIAQRTLLGNLESEAFNRAMVGEPEFIMHAGKMVMVKKRGKDGKLRRVPLVVRRKSDPILLAMLRAESPEGYDKRLAVKPDGGGINIGPVHITNNTQINQLHPDRVADLDELELMLVDTFKRAGLTMDLGESDAAEASNEAEEPSNGNGEG